MAFVARAPRSAPFGAATTPQEVADAACDALPLYAAAWMTLAHQFCKWLPRWKLLQLLERTRRIYAQVGPGSYTVPTRHGSRYPSYVPFATSTERACEADQTSHQVPHCLLLLDTGLSKKPVLAVPWVAIGAHSCADIHRCRMCDLRCTVIAV